MNVTPRQTPRRHASISKPGRDRPWHTVISFRYRRPRPNYRLFPNCHPYRRLTIGRSARPRCCPCSMTIPCFVPSCSMMTRTHFLASRFLRLRCRASRFRTPHWPCSGTRLDRRPIERCKPLGRSDSPRPPGPVRWAQLVTSGSSQTSTTVEIARPTETKSAHPRRGPRRLPQRRQSPVEMHVSWSALLPFRKRQRDTAGKTPGGVPHCQITLRRKPWSERSDLLD